MPWLVFSNHTSCHCCFTFPFCLHLLGLLVISESNSSDNHFLSFSLLVWFFVPFASLFPLRATDSRQVPWTKGHIWSRDCCDCPYNWPVLVHPHFISSKTNAEIWRGWNPIFRLDSAFLTAYSRQNISGACYSVYMAEWCCTLVNITTTWSLSPCATKLEDDSKSWGWWSRLWSF